ncbi:hypothetical protein [Streptomyces sp. SID11385]|uniref:hypothetical protein n=1 Tax=Streptomyces sp. SID11385 TaxID=2706031 RepID=UPI0013C97A08|nr:hypothetical protein [Streptomyces sp. SID11385]NEA42945.1 hypothetical protein [Streptomyces sp. SID11385]
MEAGPRDTGREEREQLVQDGPADDPPPIADRVVADGEAVALGVLPSGRDDVAADEAVVEDGAVEVELRPQRRLRLWQLAPIVVLAAIGSLMFAFPLAFEAGDGGAVVAMLGLLLSSSAAGGAVMAARRVGYNWPGLAQGGGKRQWRAIGLYMTVVLVVAGLAVWRVARLR